MRTWGGQLPIVVMFALSASSLACQPNRAEARPNPARADVAAPQPDVGARQSDGGDVALLEHTTAVEYQKSHRDDDLRAWRRRVPQVNVVQIRSSADGKPQRAIWYDSGNSRPRPLLVALHSWGADYEQNLDIPFAEFAIENDWVFLHPDFRGPNVRPEATASEVAVQDVLDAVSFAKKRAAVDASRVFLVGYSGGAMKALVLAGRHPELWGGVAAWGGIFDIADWYRHDLGKNSHYRKDIVASCGGVPTPGSAAEAECRERSPASQLARASDAVPVFIAHGLRDTTVPPRHAVLAYNVLAAPRDRFTDAQRDSLDKGAVPPELAQFRGRSPSLFAQAGAPVRLERRSRAVTLVLYDGGHDMIYNAGLRWLSQQQRR